MSVGVFRYQFDYDHEPRFCWEIDSAKYRWLKVHVTPAFQPRMPRKLSETFRMLGRFPVVKIWLPIELLKSHMLIIYTRYSLITMLY